MRFQNLRNFFTETQVVSSYTVDILKLLLLANDPILWIVKNNKSLMMTKVIKLKS